MNVTGEIPDIVVGRLPIYLRELNRMARSEDNMTTSSRDLGHRLGISSAQIRKDLSHFGEFGKQGTGYHIGYLIDQLTQILHLKEEWGVAVVGAGYLGHALANYRGFQDRGFHVVCVFDKDLDKVGIKMGDLTVQGIDELEETIDRMNVEMAIIAVPVSVAQEITDRLVKAGVKALLSYVPIHLNVPEGVQVSYSDPVVQMQRMTYYLTPVATTAAESST
ncbi:MAG: redox-sensing transcriptional repressor Rex [Chloroflexi bacterium]|jgi:redox-sensing transcriptional repressor|nr:redox-sensing transcriptional repressor Rex [Chloroflexota bacterium]